MDIQPYKCIDPSLAVYVKLERPDVPVLTFAKKIAEDYGNAIALACLGRDEDVADFVRIVPEMLDCGGGPMDPRHLLTLGQVLGNISCLPETTAPATRDALSTMAAFVREKAAPFVNSAMFDTPQGRAEKQLQESPRVAFTNPKMTAAFVEVTTKERDHINIALLRVFAALENDLASRRDVLQDHKAIVGQYHGFMEGGMQVVDLESSELRLPNGSNIDFLYVVGHILKQDQDVRKSPPGVGERLAVIGEALQEFVRIHKGVDGLYGRLDDLVGRRALCSVLGAELNADGTVV